MKTNSDTGCAMVRETLDAAFGDVFEAPEDSGLSLMDRLRVRLHCLFCPRCDEVYRQVLECRELARTGFFPGTPSFEDSVMAGLADDPAFDNGDAREPAGGFSFRAWAVIGCFVLVSLAIAFLGMDFIPLASRLGSSFLVPLGITIGIVVTCYGAFFIGSHLGELTEHFKIQHEMDREQQVLEKDR